MLRQLLLVPFLAIGIVGCADTEPDTLTVSAEMTLEVPADTASVEMIVYKAAGSREQALDLLTSEHNLIKSDIRQIENISYLHFESSDISVRQVPSQECLLSIVDKLPEYSDADDLLDYYELCPDTQYSASVSLLVKVQPAQAASSILSYASLADVERFELGEFSLLDIREARRDAKSAAAGKVRLLAQDVAKESGVKLGKMKELSFRGVAHFENDINEIPEFPEDEIVVTGSRVKDFSEKVPLDIEPPMIEIEERVIATFAISE